jgi:hypothetical protein
LNIKYCYKNTPTLLISVHLEALAATYSNQPKTMQHKQIGIANNNSARKYSTMLFENGYAQMQQGTKQQQLITIS